MGFFLVGRRRALGLLGIVGVFAAGVNAQQAPSPTTQPSALGRLARYDPVHRVVTLDTSRGPLTFVLAEDAALREGVRSIEADRVAALIGRTAKVRYQTVGSRRVARQMTVAAAASRPARDARPPGP